MILLRRTFSISLFLLCLALTAPPSLHAAVDSTEITKEEWSAFLQQSSTLKTADAKLNATYKKAMQSLSQSDKRALLNEQRAWIASRNSEAFSKHGKGSPAYLNMLAEASEAREEALRKKYLHTSPVQPAVQQAAQPASQPQKNEPEQVQAEKIKPIPAQTEKASAALKPVVETKAPSPVPAQPAAKKETANAVPKQPQGDDLVVTVPAQKTRRTGRKINITPKKFSESYNALALGFRAASFPLVPAKVGSYGNDRTESYPVTDGISIQFKYTNGSFEKPETITFLAHSFVGGTTAHRENIAYALVGLLKSLSYNPAKDDKAKDAEIFGFMRSINNAFTSDSSRVWKNDGLVYVITYLKKSDMFAMVVNVDEKQKR